MAGKTAILAVKFLGDATGAERACAELERAVTDAERATASSGKKMAGVWAAVAAGMAVCIKQSAALEASTNALATIFGEQADEMLEWAEGMAQSAACSR